MYTYDIMQVCKYAYAKKFPRDLFLKGKCWYYDNAQFNPIVLGDPWENCNRTGLKFI